MVNASHKALGPVSENIRCLFQLICLFIQPLSLIFANTYEHFLLRSSPCSSEVLLINLTRAIGLSAVGIFTLVGKGKKGKEGPFTCQILSAVHFRPISTDCVCSSQPCFQPEGSFMVNYDIIFFFFNSLRDDCFEKQIRGHGQTFIQCIELLK